MPRTVPSAIRRQPKQQRHDELLDAVYDRLERNDLDVELVLPVEGRPLPLLRFVPRELRRQRGWQCRREPGLAPLEGSHDRFGEDLSLE